MGRAPDEGRRLDGGARNLEGRLEFGEDGGAFEVGHRADDRFQKVRHCDVQRAWCLSHASRKRKRRSRWVGLGDGLGTVGGVGTAALGNQKRTEPGGCAGARIRAGVAGAQWFLAPSPFATG